MLAEDTRQIVAAAAGALFAPYGAALVAAAERPGLDRVELLSLAAFARRLESAGLSAFARLGGGVDHAAVASAIGEVADALPSLRRARPGASAP